MGERASTTVYGPEADILAEVRGVIWVADSFLNSRGTVSYLTLVSWFAVSGVLIRQMQTVVAIHEIFADPLYC
jgi:hypothetical protein